MQVQTHVDFPLRHLDLTPFVDGAAPPFTRRVEGGAAPAYPVYNLGAVVCHHGRGIDSGHYFAYCYDGEHGACVRARARGRVPVRA